MVTPLLTLRPDGSFDATRDPITPTKAGALRVVGDGWFVEEGTTNFVLNPMQDPSGAIWIPYGGGAVAFDTTVYRDGIASAKGTTTTSTGGVNARTTPTIQGVPYTISAYIRTDTQLSFASAVYYTADSGGGNTNLFSTVVSPTSGAWGRSVLTGITRADRVISHIDITSYNPNPNGNVLWNMDSAQAEAKDHLTSFCPQYDSNGILLSGYQWTGTPHASASTRTAASIGGPVPGFASAYIRYSEGGIEGSAYLEGDGMIGTYGQLVIADDVATITSMRATTVMAELFYNRALTDGEVDKLDATPTALLGWSSLLRKPSGILRIDKPGFQIPGILKIGA